MSPQDRKHGREAARRRAAHAVARAEARRRQRRMRVVIASILAVVVVLAVVLTSVGGGDDTTTTASDSSSTTSPESGTTASTSAATTEVPAIPSEDGVFQYGKGECPPDTPPSTPKRHFTSSPKRCLEDGVDYRAVVKTSEGTFTMDLLEKKAPGTVNNFVVLARWGYFDGLTFHRVVPGFVVQGGDPNGDGSGGPGYAIADELPSAIGDYKPGAVAMANSGPDTNGSQFFVCIDCSGLPTAGYSLFGQVVDGTEVVQAIDALGAGDGPPSKTVTIEKVTIQEG